MCVCVCMYVDEKMSCYFTALSVILFQNNTLAVGVTSVYITFRITIFTAEQNARKLYMDTCFYNTLCVTHLIATTNVVEETDGELLEVVIVVHEVRDLENGLFELGALAMSTLGSGDDCHVAVLHRDIVRTLYSLIAVKGQVSDQPFLRC